MRAKTPDWNEMLQGAMQLELGFPAQEARHGGNGAPEAEAPKSIDELVDGEFAAEKHINERFAISDRGVISENLRRMGLLLEPNLANLSYWNQFFWGYNSVGQEARDAIKGLWMSGRMSNDEFLSVFVGFYLIRATTEQFHRTYRVCNSSKRNHQVYHVTLEMETVFNFREQIADFLRSASGHQRFLYIANTGNYARGHKINVSYPHHGWMIA